MRMVDILKTNPEVNTNKTPVVDHERYLLVTGQKLSPAEVAKMGGEQQVHFAQSGWMKHLDGSDNQLTQVELKALGGAENLKRFDKISDVSERMSKFDQPIEDLIKQRDLILDPDFPQVSERSVLVNKIVHGAKWEDLNEDERGRLSGEGDVGLIKKGWKDHQDGKITENEMIANPQIENEVFALAGSVSLGGVNALTEDMSKIAAHENDVKTADKKRGKFEQAATELMVEQGKIFNELSAEEKEILLPTVDVVNETDKKNDEVKKDDVEDKDEVPEVRDDWNKDEKPGEETIDVEGLEENKREGGEDFGEIEDLPDSDEDLKPAASGVEIEDLPDSDEDLKPAASGVEIEDLPEDDGVIEDKEADDLDRMESNFGLYEALANKGIGSMTEDEKEELDRLGEFVDKHETEYFEWKKNQEVEDLDEKNEISEDEKHRNFETFRKTALKQINGEDLTDDEADEAEDAQRFMIVNDLHEEYKKWAKELNKKQAEDDNEKKDKAPKKVEKENKGKKFLEKVGGWFKGLKENVSIIIEGVKGKIDNARMEDLKHHKRWFEQSWKWRQAGVPEIDFMTQEKFDTGMAEVMKAMNEINTRKADLAKKAAEARANGSKTKSLIFKLLGL